MTMRYKEVLARPDTKRVPRVVEVYRRGELTTVCLVVEGPGAGVKKLNIWNKNLVDLEKWQPV